MAVAEEARGQQPPEDRLVELVSDLTGLPAPRVEAAAPRLRSRAPTEPDRALRMVAEAIVTLRNQPLGA